MAATCQTCGATLEPDAVAAALPADLLLGGRFRIERVLGRGGFGITYRTTDLEAGFPLMVGVSHTSEETVAVKELFPDGVVTRQSDGSVLPNAGMEAEFAQLKQRFSLEAQTLTRIQHPATTHFVAAWEECGTAYLAMEFVQGETLETRLLHSKLSEREARAALRNILELLTEVHALDLLHRDIKPGNIVLQVGGAQLIDFGSVTPFERDGATIVTSRMLTPQYAPLELYGTNVTLGPSSDLYSLAASLYEGLSGVKPPAALERAGGAVLQPLESLMPNLDLALARTLDAALSLRVAERPASATRMLELLNTPVAVATTAVPSVPPSSPVGAAPLKASAPSIVVFGTAMTVGLIVQLVVSTPRVESAVTLMVLLVGVMVVTGLLVLLGFLSVRVLRRAAIWLTPTSDEMIFESLSSYTAALLLIWPLLRGDGLLALMAIALGGFAASYLLARLQRTFPASPLERSLWAVVAAVMVNLVPWVIVGR
jgi:serine/threonine-protein kinase